MSASCIFAEKALYFHSMSSNCSIDFVSRLAGVLLAGLLLRLVR